MPWKLNPFTGEFDFYDVGDTTAKYSDISDNDSATDVSGSELEELTDGSQTTLHSHASAAATTFIGLSDSPSAFEAASGVRVNSAGNALEFYSITDADSKVGVDSGATPDYLGAASGDGSLRTGASIDYSDGGNFVTLSVTPSAVDHDTLNNFVANEHIDHTSVTLSAGDGLSGGGDIDSTRTIHFTGDYSVVSDNDGNTDVSGAELEELTDGSQTTLHSHAAGSDVLAAIDSAATAQYVGTASSDGFLRTDATIDYADGGNYVTLSVTPSAVDHDTLLNFAAGEHFVQGDINEITSAIGAGILTTDGGTLASAINNITAWEDASDHATGTGSDHSLVVTNNNHVTGDGTDHSVVASNQDHATGTGADHSLVVTNNNHVTGDGSDHSVVASNEDHATGSGLDHSTVATNRTHATGDGLDHSEVVTVSDHATGDGTDHSEVVAASNHATGTGADHSLVVTNNNHVTGDGTDHSVVASNQDHATGTGGDHSLVVTNNNHVTGDGLDHSVVDTNRVHATGTGADHSLVVTNNNHVTGDGLDHSVVDTNRVHATGTGADHSLVVTNNNHVTGDGSDHSVVGTNRDHATGTGSDHSMVVTNNDHITANGSSHSYLDQSVTTSASVTFQDISIAQLAYFDAEYDNESASAVDWNNGNKQLTTLKSALTASFTDPSGACNLM